MLQTTVPVRGNNDQIYVLGIGHLGDLVVRAPGAHRRLNRNRLANHLVAKAFEGGTGVLGHLPVMQHGPDVRKLGRHGGGHHANEVFSWFCFDRDHLRCLWKRTG